MPCNPDTFHIYFMQRVHFQTIAAFYKYKIEPEVDLRH